MCPSVVLQNLFAVVLLILFAPKCVHSISTTEPFSPSKSAQPSSGTTSEHLPMPKDTATDPTDIDPTDKASESVDTNSEETETSTGTTSYASSAITSYYLETENCTESSTQPIKNFEIIIDGGILTKDEGKSQLVTCRMKSMASASCNELLRELNSNTNIFMHHGTTSTDRNDHVILENATKTITMEDDGDSLFQVQFNFTVHRHHNDRYIYCNASSDSLGRAVTSKKKQFASSIDKLYKVSVTPDHVEVPPNTAFTLTCKFQDVAVKGYIYWESKKDSDDHQWVEVDNSIAEVIGNSSVLTVTKNEEWNGTYMCTTKHNQHPNQHRDVVTVLVKAPDKSVIHGTTIALVVSAVLILLTVVALLLRRRTLKKRIEISLMLMELQEAGANAQQTAMVGSVHSLTMEPAVNCYASSLNPDGSLAAETLAATFARFTSMYAPWQKERSKLVIKHILGEGNFGSVCLGIMPDVYFQGVTSQVAVKTIKPARMDKQAITEFEKEVSIMTTLKHENIVNLVGLCTEMMPLYIIMEYMENGPLNDFLMGKAPNKLEDTSLSTRDLLYMSLQPCKALEYLSNKNVVHRDISARNCLVGDKLSVKLADFGLSRGTAIDDGKNYYKKDGGMVPVKWMAPEALNFGKYTSANDVWSFGVLMWEIFSFGAIPYLSHSNQQVIVFVNRGGRLEKPDYCPQSIWEHVCLCWTKAPEDRITIGGLVNMLSTELDIIDTSDNNGQTSQSFNI